ncbi:hypothetical protein MPTK1_3g03230 [Marchantia polymorpha subsp. ruderalis]|uniref:Uncharacterized protein n=2 Tax=Marchantia polymorpha TaxID=3197 RepID=A0AAF6AWZ1_MARPO|nr:hypothetical protein MARPO_0212s0003 [Marchantia polymorpha]BBN04275.1 hypothetical protein Mp_3g03230 [Marchantia polymorpha subsp. ruderalis]|eukprot:PTQ27224.1 hypothetical protein MARPO_0212s0003 [Marchantia polymorpha]
MMCNGCSSGGDLTRVGAKGSPFVEEEEESSKLSNQLRSPFTHSTIARFILPCTGTSEQPMLLSPREGPARFACTFISYPGIVSSLFPVLGQRTSQPASQPACLRHDNLPLDSVLIIFCELLVRSSRPASCNESILACLLVCLSAPAAAAAAVVA